MWDEHPYDTWFSPSDLILDFSFAQVKAKSVVLRRLMLLSALLYP
jgi:hypothetical protein